MTLEDLASARPLPPFDGAATGFVTAMSNELLTRPRFRRYPELVALGYWMRPASISRLDSMYGSGAQGEGLAVLPRGRVFHLAPGNVDTIFVYSWLLSLLAGNTNVVRLSRRTSPQLDEILSLLADLLDAPAHRPIRARTLLVRYDPDPRRTELLSSHSDIRVIWGGDAAVAEIRSVPLPPLATELVFGDRFSVAVVGCHAWGLASEEVRRRAVHGFVNDSYWFGQMACSSPRLVAWVGAAAEREAARSAFWALVRDELGRRDLGLSAADYLNKRAATASLAIRATCEVASEPTADLVRAWLTSPSEAARELHCGAGLFWEVGCDTLDALLPLLDRRVQTIAHFGFESASIRKFVQSNQPEGGDRWVPFGAALNFSHIWDGFDLMRVFTRQVVVQP